MKSLDDKLKEIPLEVLNQITIQSLTGSENAKLNNPSTNGKKGGLVTSEVKKEQSRKNGAQSQLRKDSNYQSEMGKKGGKKGGKVMGNIIRTCPHCGREIKGPSYFQHINRHNTNNNE